METVRTYGEPPYSVAVVHGGPGAPGSMALVAQELSLWTGVLEPFQTRETVQGQLEELEMVLEEYSSMPVVLLGHSYGAWLSFLLAAQYPERVKKLILVGSGPFTTEYVSFMNRERDARLTKEEKKQLQAFSVAWDRCEGVPLAEEFQALGRIMSRVDSYCEITDQDQVVEYRVHLFYKNMQEMKSLREGGGLLASGGEIKSPVLAIHGEHDTHPFQGVLLPLFQVVKDFRFILLPRCGHTPWNERCAREAFFDILRKEIQAG